RAGAGAAPPAGAPGVARGHLEPRARRPGPPLPRPGLAPGRRQSDRGGGGHDIQPPRPWAHHVHRAAAGKSRGARGGRRRERSPPHPRRPPPTPPRGAPSPRAGAGHLAPGRDDHRADELTTRMRRYLAIAALAAGLLGLATGALVAEEFSMIELAAPPAAARGQSVELAITTGSLPPGARLALATENGETPRAVAPYPPGSRSTTATVPVPRSA